MGKTSVKLKLSGLSCAGCVATVKSALESVGAKDVSVTLERAEFSIDEGEKIDKFIQAIEKSGYNAVVEHGY
jgi:copper chaperone CopZ